MEITKFNFWTTHKLERYRMVSRRENEEFQRKKSIEEHTDEFKEIYFSGYISFH